MSEQDFQITVKASPNLVKLEFGVPIDGFGLQTEAAINLANAILKAAEDSKKEPAPVRGPDISPADFDQAVADALKGL